MYKPVIYNVDDTETKLPTKWEICHTCSGHGKHSRDVECDGGGITSSEMAEICHDDPDFLEDYRSGFYDRRCDNCNGTGKVQVADESRMNKVLRKKWRDQIQADREIDAIHAAERRMGA